MGVPRDPDQAAGYYRRAVHDSQDDALRKIAQDAADGVSVKGAVSKP
jgi:TPR repeat protein